VRTKHKYETLREKATPSLKRLMAGLSPGFDPRPVSVRFVTDTVASGQIFLRVFLFSPVSIIPPMFHAR
jgi:hypothetical protein